MAQAAPRDKAQELAPGEEYLYFEDEPPAYGQLSAPIKTDYGAVTGFRTARYLNGARAIRLYDEYGDVYGDLSTNLGVDLLPPNAFRADHNIDPTILRQLEDQGMIRKADEIPDRRSGFVSFAAYEWIG